MSTKELPTWGAVGAQPASEEYPMIEFLSGSELLPSHTKTSSESVTNSSGVGTKSLVDSATLEDGANSYTCDTLQLTGDEFRRKIQEVRERRRQEYEASMARQVEATAKPRHEAVTTTSAVTAAQESTSSARDSLTTTRIFQQSQHTKQSSSQPKSTFSLPRTAFASDVDFVTDALARFCVGENDIIDLSTMTWRPRTTATESSPTSNATSSASPQNL